MRKSDILIFFIGWCLVWGIISGAVVGFLFQLAFFGPVTYGLFGLFVGVIAGALLGVANGIVLAIVTIRFPDPLENVQKYKDALTYASFRLTLFGSGIFFFVVFRFLTNDTTSAFCIAFPASIFAALAAFYAVQKVSRWYVISLMP